MPLRGQRTIEHKRGAVKASEIFSTVSISHALFTPCQSDGEKIREVEAIRQLRKIAEVKINIAYLIHQLLLDYHRKFFQNWTHGLVIIQR